MKILTEYVQTAFASLQNVISSSQKLKNKYRKVDDKFNNSFICGSAILMITQNP